MNLPPNTNNNINNNMNQLLNTQQISNLLLNTHSSINEVRSNAENELNNITNTQFSRLMFTLCYILSSASEQQPVRVAAGLYLKNMLGGESARSEMKLNEIRNRWHSQPLNMRQQLKQQILNVLHLENKEARNTAANIIANLVAVETLKNWKDLIPNLLSKVLSSMSTDNFMHSVLLCFGRIAENVDTHQELHPYSSSILQLIAKGMSSANLDLQSTAMLCLYYMVDFIHSNMEEKSDRDIILQMICVGATNMSNNQLRLYSMMSIARICEQYYQLLQPYMQSIFGITKSTIEAGVVARKETIEITKQAIEVWSVTAEVEIFINHNNNDNKYENFGFVQKVLPTIVPLYLQALMMQRDEELDEDEYGIRKSAAVSLELFAHVTKSNILGEVLKFVEKYISDNDWHGREAALCAFGYILDGPPAGELRELVAQILPVILVMMKDNNMHVKITACWTCGRICLYVPQAIEIDLLPNLIECLNMNSKMATKACWCFASLAAYFTNVKSPISIYSESKKIFNLMKELLARAERADCDARLIPAVFEALNSIMFYAPEQANEMIKSLIPELVNRLKCYTSKEDKTDIDMHRIASILTAIAVAINIAGKQCIDNDLANDIMSCSCAMSMTKHELISEEILTCMVAVANSIGVNFFTYLCTQQVQALFLESINISNGQNNTQLCLTGASTIGDVFRSCVNILSVGNGSEQLNIQPFTDQTVNFLLECLMSSELEMKCKPHIIDALVDICLAHGKNSIRYNHRIIAECLALGSSISDENIDEDFLNILNEVRISIIDVCRTAILEFSRSSNEQQFNEFMPAMVIFFKMSIINCDDEVLKALLQFLSEMAEYCDISTIVNLRVSEVTNIFDKAKNSNNMELGRAAINAFTALKARS